jgi:hypothetical protein
MSTKPKVGIEENSWTGVEQIMIRILPETDMRYDEFRDRLHYAFCEAGLLFPQSDRLVETIDLTDTSRRWKAYFSRSAPQDLEPFYVSAQVTFEWSSVNAARAHTCEEDLLTELLGRRQESKKTQQRWIRVDLELYARLPYGATAPIHDAELFGSWITSVGEKLSGLLTEIKERQQRVVAVLGACEEVEVDARCSSEGLVSLKGVSISGFRIVRIPRIWDDPRRRKAEKDIGGELISLARRLRDASEVWTESIAELVRWIRYSPPPPELRPIEPSLEDEEEDEDNGPQSIH